MELPSFGNLHVSNSYHFACMYVYIYIYFLQLVEANTQLSPPLQSASSNTLFFSLSFKYTNMKISLHLGALLFILFFLLSSSKLCARPLTTEQGKDFNSEMEGGESFKLLGVEDCNSGDEECLKRRMTLEAHLDYIYTQNHKP